MMNQEHIKILWRAFFPSCMFIWDEQFEIYRVYNIGDMYKCSIFHSRKFNFDEITELWHVHIGDMYICNISNDETSHNHFNFVFYFNTEETLLSYIKFIRHEIENHYSK